MRFSGKVVVVTGAGSGIGAATARRFAEEGASVALAGRRRGKLEEVAAGLDPARALAVETDVAEQGAVEALVAAAAERFGRLDVLVNNAGTAKMGGFLDGSLEDYRAIMATNVDGVVFACRAALPHLLRSGGSIVNVSSVSAANQALMAKFADRMPMGRPARAEEVAAVIAFLASEDASFVNGVNLPVDGGLGASNGQPRIG
jgi:meso-butanediol dehydrogenase/(S,S)-butanediol dehydrogenase/diacetyl reductase